METTLATVSKWAGRIVATALFLFWGMFFVEHLQEWFLRADGRYPPARVFAGQFLHFGIMAGLALMWRWERVGAAVLAVCTVGFFAAAGITRFHWVMLLNLTPLVVFAWYWMVQCKQRA